MTIRRNEGNKKERAKWIVKNNNLRKKLSSVIDPWRIEINGIQICLEICHSLQSYTMSTV